ncbi:helix-turn-helix transcriptional regulator [Frigoribacterium sp. CFBP 13729]|uniref:winged helix-turn-helix transcriptional regulator n=1 Tax=unclassified Frigoribacterium TaxID=2627005 RepID=UPI001785883D|nr:MULTISPECIES: helix-turn-helix domain-containing protein [unclassified Frigoribacterium]MBD8583577.1 helix-turn-helix transcriptional regulator [Frigoribacterium sp. CFBP 8766]MBD8610355.1 helix-turn-helix transcriptional regulator [Frigoribacterium sp. CFBP 13729]
MDDTTSLPGPELLHVDAPHRELLDELLDKWSLQVLDQLCERPLRFNELRRVVPAVGQKSLTATLRRLERNGMVERVVLQTRPIAVEYRIAPIGDSLNELVDALLTWTSRNLPEVERARARYDAETDA